jgi:hypothetical protein
MDRTCPRSSDLDESRGHVDTIIRVNMKAILSGQLLTYWIDSIVGPRMARILNDLRKNKTENPSSPYPRSVFAKSFC